MSTKSSIVLGSGVSVAVRTDVPADCDAIKTLYESGVPVPEIAKLFKILPKTIREYASKSAWLRPTKVKRMRQEMARRQRNALITSGKHVDVNALKASIWQDRGEFLRERSYDILEEALTSVDKTKAKTLIKDAKDFKTLVEVGGLLTGNTNPEDKPLLALNISFLRGGVAVEDAIDV